MILRQVEESDSFLEYKAGKGDIPRRSRLTVLGVVPGHQRSQLDFEEFSKNHFKNIKWSQHTFNCSRILSFREVLTVTSCRGQSNLNPR